MLRDNASAEDAAQEACARALDALPHLRQPERFAPWFYRIVVNEATRRLRAVGREVPFDAASGEPTDRDVTATMSWEDRLDVRSAIDALEPSLRVTVVLRYYFGMSSAEIGGILRVSPITARWRLMRAHRQLRELLGPSARPGVSIAEEPCG
jgi:RNA polymerase sigma-70 factor (ECF subfamily)